MSFILKNNPTVLNIKLTNLGRQLLSQGKLTMTKWAVGDSEIDYVYDSTIETKNPAIVGTSAFNTNILRPKDNNPKFTSFILRDDTDLATQYTQLPTVVSNTNIITNTASVRGFFNVNGNNTTLLSDSLRMKQGDMRVQISEITGGTTLKIKQAPSYLSNPNEPIVGDYILVKWINPIVTGNSVNFTIDANQPLPFIWYKIEGIISGSLSANNLKVTVDKPLPHFNSQGSGKYSPVFLYPNNNNRLISGDSIQTYYSTPYTTDFINESVIAFLENGIVPLRDVPVWNMAIVFREDIAGLRSTNRNYSQYYSRFYGGFIKYIQQLDNTINKIGIIHFSNASPSNLYGEGFFADTPVLNLPTIMWHYETGNTIGLKLTCDGAQKILPNLETPYYDLVDKFGHVLGKAFIDLKIFVIEDQELLFVMSYKSNRNWTLPKPVIGLNLSICDPCVLSILTTVVNTTGGNDNGSITITASNGTGALLYSIDNGVTYVTTNIFTGLAGGNYDIKVVDSGAGNCIATDAVTVANSV